MLGGGFFERFRLSAEVSAGSLPFLGRALEADVLGGERMLYMNGPLFRTPTDGEPAVDPAIKNTLVLGRLAGDGGGINVWRDGKTRETGFVRLGKYNGTAVLVANRFGKGRVVLSTGHPETAVGSAEALERPTCSSKLARLFLDMVMISAGRTLLI